MNQTRESKSGKQFYSISGISEKMQRDIAYLREHLDIIPDEYEVKLIEDLERFLVNDVAREIRLCLYDPLEKNRVYIEYCYKIEPYSSSFSSEDKLEDHVKLWRLPETCLFDIFIYFTTRFEELEPELQKEILRYYNLDWYDISFNLRYSRKDKRKRTGVLRSDDLFVNRYLYESRPTKKIIEGSSEKGFSEKIRDEEGRRKGEKKSGGRSVAGYDNFEDQIIEAVQGERKLNYIIYRDMESAVASINYVMEKYDKFPIRWSLSRGFAMDNYSQGSGQKSSLRNIKNPATALKFIVDNRENRVSYILEDFHHHIGGASAINTAVAEIRALIRDLSRDLKERDEFVFFMSPQDSVPIELAPLFNLIKQEPAEKDVSFLSKYGFDMTDPGLVGKNKPLIGREGRIQRIVQVLCQMETNNPLLVGGAGVGKTALVEGLALEIAKGNVPPPLKRKTIFSLNLNSLIAGSKYRGEFEERISRLIDDVKSQYRDIIIFIDEIHTILGAGSAEGASGAEDILKPALARGDFPCIGATTYEGFDELQQDPALARRFQKLEVPPATEGEAEKVLHGVKHIFEKHHEIKITGEAILMAVKLSEKYNKDQFLPGKAVRLLDSASALVKLEGRNSLSASDIEEEIKRSRD